MDIQDGEDEFGRGQLKIINKKIYLEFCDDYEHVDDTAEYITENILMEPPTQQSIDAQNAYAELTTLYNSCLTNSCKCEYSDVSSCNRFKDSDTYFCTHGGNYTSTVIDPKYPHRKELVLCQQRPAIDLIFECTALCGCALPAPLCQNRLLQFGPRKMLKIVPSLRLSAALGSNQMELITKRLIPTGGFICEYVGEIITKEEAQLRHTHSYFNSMNYIICLNEYPQNSKMEENISKSPTSAAEKQQSTKNDINTSIKSQTFIDPSRKGNVGRYLNHSCEPNCEILSVRVDGPIPRLGMV